MSTSTSTLRTAFSLVCPLANAQELAIRGIIANADHASWKDEIAALVTADELAEANVTIADIFEAIEHFTATHATVRACKVGSLPWVTFLGDGKPGFLIQAPGYRKGPACDH
jgi:hypothetical protein